MRKCQDWARTHSNLCANFTCFCQNKVWKNILAPWLDRLATWRDISGFPAAARKSWCVEQLFTFLPRLEAWDAIVQCIEAHQIYAQQLKFLQWVRKTKKSSNLSLLIADSVPKTGGEKRTARQKRRTYKKTEWQTGTISPKSIAILIQQLSPFAWSNKYTPQPPQFRPCPVGFQFQSPVYTQCVDMYSNRQHHLLTLTPQNGFDCRV